MSNSSNSTVSHQSDDVAAQFLSTDGRHDHPATLSVTQAQPLRRSRCAILVERRTTRPSCNLVSSKLSGALSGLGLAERRTLLPSGNVMKNDAVGNGMHIRAVPRDRYVARRTNPLLTREGTDEGLVATTTMGVESTMRTGFGVHDIGDVGSHDIGDVHEITDASSH
jgi:hypothetical protein